MKYAFFPGCTVQAEQFGYEASVRKVLPRIDVELVDMEGTSCCGFPAFSSVYPLAWYYLSARNMATAEGFGLELFPLCNGCYMSFAETKHHLKVNPTTKNSINKVLKKEGLTYTGNVRIVHILEILYDIIGVDTIKANVIRSMKGLKFATHPGCHAIRGGELNHADDPENPQKLDNLMRALGADVMDYPEKTDCCGSSLAFTSGKTTLLIAGEKLQSVRKFGFDGLVTVCPFCFKVFDNRQRAIGSAVGNRSLEVPVFYYTQLLGLAMGLGPKKLGLDLNLSPIDPVLEKILEG